MRLISVDWLTGHFAVHCDELDVDFKSFMDLIRPPSFMEKCACIHDKIVMAKWVAYLVWRGTGLRPRR